jgi:hypothetical protein
MFTCTYWCAVLWLDLAKNWYLRIFDKFDSQNPLISNRFDEPQPACLPAISQPDDAWSQPQLQPGNHTVQLSQH